MQGSGTTSSEVFTKKVQTSVAVPTVLAVVRLYVLAQRIDLAVQAKHGSLSQVNTLQTLLSAPSYISKGASLKLSWPEHLPFSLLYIIVYVVLSASTSSHKVCTAKHCAIALASVRLTHCCVSDARSWQALGTTKPVHQLQSCWQGLCWVWWPTLRSSRTAYGWLERTSQGTSWTAPSRCVRISLNLTHGALTAYFVFGAGTLRRQQTLTACTTAAASMTLATSCSGQNCPPSISLCQLNGAVMSLKAQN